MFAAIAGRDDMLITPADKAALRRASDAAAADMESHGVAAAAAERNLPFIAVRAIADPASHSVPWCAQAGLAADGRTRPLAVMGRLARRPWELPPLIAVALDTAKALAALRRFAAAAFGGE